MILCWFQWSYSFPSWPILRLWPDKLPESPDRFPTRVFWQTGLLPGSASQQCWHIGPQCPSCCVRARVLTTLAHGSPQAGSGAWNYVDQPGTEVNQKLWAVGLGRAPGLLECVFSYSVLYPGITLTWFPQLLSRIFFTLILFKLNFWCRDMN